MSRLAKVKSFYNINLTSDDEVFVGIDVHKKSYHVAFALNGVPAIDFNMVAKPKKLNEKLQPMAQSIKQIVYETGPTGYGLVRNLIKNKFPASVVATSRIPRPATADDKTDKLDSIKLAQYAAKGLLHPIAIPTLRQEADRQLYRMRHRQAHQFAKVKVQIKSFLLMHGIDEPEELKNWTLAGVQYLRDMRLLDTLRLSLDELLNDYDYFNSRVKQLSKTIAASLDKGVLGRRMGLLKTHPGVGAVVSCQFVTELFHYKDFSSAKQLYKYLGLCPRVSQSGERSSSGSINKAANGRLRNNLIQAAWSWVRTDIEASKCFWRIYKNCGGLKQKAIVAMARKMSGHLWAMLMNDQPYDKEKAKSRLNKEKQKKKESPAAMLL
jgi:transposase